LLVAGILTLPPLSVPVVVRVSVATSVGIPSPIIIAHNVRTGLRVVGGSIGIVGARRCWKIRSSQGALSFVVIETATYKTASCCYRMSG